ncbi:acyltransferase ChoActase/COT/CPT, partial [Dimargaris cristalligena]
LPALPLPDLAQTCERYLSSVRPLVSDEAYQRTEQAVAEFLASEEGEGPGAVLQHRLAAHKDRVDADPACRNWLEAWWNEYAYFSNRVSNCFYVNFFFGLRDDPRNPSQLQRAASLTQAALQFRRQVVRNELTPDKVRTTLLCMFQYRYLFNTCRYPATPLDYTRRHEAPTGTPDYTHIAVTCRGQVYVMDTVHPAATAEEEPVPLSMDELAQRSHGISILTSGTRDQWAADRTALLAVDPANADHLFRLESAAFLVALEDEAYPATREEFARECWHGKTGENRFHDKCFQLLVFGNGRAGFSGEHSLSDGTTALRLCRYLLTEEEAAPLAQVPGPGDEGPSATGFAHLALAVDPAVADRIRRAHVRFQAEVAAHQVGVLEFDTFGKDRIKKLRCSPDAFVQMAIQLAYYRMHGTCRATYESTATKKYSHGRTETARSVSMDALRFVQAMDQPLRTANENGNVTEEPVDRAALCQVAIATHSRAIAQCADGAGIDRHLLGLKFCLRADESVPALFADPSFSTTNHWYLSTSQISDELIEEYGWGEVVPDGYGIAYMIKEKSLHFNVAALAPMRAKALAHHLQLALVDMYALLSND